MSPFEYMSCGTVTEATAALSDDGARVIAGGTDLLLSLRRPNARSPRLIVDVSRIEQLRKVTRVVDTITLGAAVTHAEISASPLLCSGAPLLQESSACVGSPQIRNRGTVGGNIMNAATCADTVPSLIALGASAEFDSATGSRTIPLSDLFEAPYRTRARHDELLSAVRFTSLPVGSGSAFVKLGRRNAMSIARLSVAAILIMGPGGIISEARIVPGAAVPVWRRFTAAEALLVGQLPSSALFTAAGEKAALEMVSVTGRRWSTEYKEPVLAVLVRRALERALARAKASGVQRP